MSSIAELKDKKQMEDYIAELKEDKKQMKEHYESIVAELKEDKKQMEDHYEATQVWADKYANAGDEELIAEFKKRFVVPQFYTREQIVEKIEAGVQGRGLKVTDDKVDEVIADFVDDSYNAIDEILEGYIDNVDFEECAECCKCGDDVSNDNGTGSLIEGEYWCKTCVEEKE